MQAWRPPTSWPIAPRTRDRVPAAPNRPICCAHLGSVPLALAGSTVAVDDGQLPAVFGDRDTQLHAANILGEAGTVIEWRARTLGLGPSLRGTLGARALAPRWQKLLISSAFGRARQDSNLHLTDYESVVCAEAPPRSCVRPARRDGPESPTVPASSP